MSEWLDIQKQSSNDIRQLTHERIEKANLRLKLTTEENSHLINLEAIADKLQRGENMLNRQPHTQRNDHKQSRIEAKWKEQLRRPEDLKDKLDHLKRYFEKLKEASIANE
jgi:hypothetical protein